MLRWLYRWLPILCGCHCREERSFHYKGRPFPVCARCTGELIGGALAAVTFVFWHPVPGVAAVLLAPLIADGAVQAATSYESTNGKRLITGILFGYGGVVLLMDSLCAAFSLGLSLGRTWFGPKTGG